MMLDRKTAPEFIPLQKVDILEAQHELLPNAQSLHIINVGEEDIIKIEVLLKAGIRFEPEAGIANMTARMLSEGTMRYNSAQFNQELEQKGIYYEAFTDYDYLHLSFITLSKYVDTCLHMAETILSEAIFPEDELKNLKQISLQNLSVNLQKTSYLATQGFKNQLAGSNHPFGRVLQTQNIEALQRQQLVDYYQKYIKGKAFEVIASGKIRLEQIQQIHNTLGSVTIRPTSQEEIVWSFEDAKEKYQLIEKSDAIQASIRVGKSLINRKHPDFHNILFANKILGGYFGSRLMQNIREDKGYSYGISSQMVVQKDFGYMVIGTDVKSELSQQTLEEIYKEIKILSQELVSKDELERVKNYTIGAFAGSINTSFDLAEKFKAVHLYGLDYSYYQKYFKNIHEITSYKILETVQVYMKEDSFLTTVAGTK